MILVVKATSEQEAIKHALRHITSGSIESRDYRLSRDGEWKLWVDGSDSITVHEVIRWYVDGGRFSAPYPAGTLLFYSQCRS